MGQAHTQGNFQENPTQFNLHQSLGPRNSTSTECRYTGKTKFEATHGFQMNILVTGYQLMNYYTENTCVKLIYNSVHLDPVYITVSQLPIQRNLPNHACQENSFYLTFCYFHIQAIGLSDSDMERGFVNVTIDNLNVDGPNTDECHMSGLALVSVTNNTVFEPFILNQNPVVIICRNTMMWTNNSIQIPFTTFISHTPDVAVILYSYTPKISILNSDLTFEYSSCQGILLNCIRTNDRAFSGYNIAYTTSDKDIAPQEKISRLESATPDGPGECINYIIPDFENPFNIDLSHGGLNIHRNDTFIRDATIAWCKSPPDYGFFMSTNSKGSTDSFFNINLYHTTNCISVQAYPNLHTDRQMDIDCEFDLIFLDTQARFQLSQFQVSLIADIEAKCTHNKFQLKKNLFRNNPRVSDRRYKKQVVYWSTQVDLKCGYFNINLRTTPLAQLSSTNTASCRVGQIVTFQTTTTGKRTIPRP